MSAENTLTLAGIITDYVAKRLAGLNVPVDATLAQDHGVIDEATVVARVAIYWAAAEIAAQSGPGGPLAGPAQGSVLRAAQQAVGTLVPGAAPLVNAVAPVVSSVLQAAQTAGS